MEKKYPYIELANELKGYRDRIKVKDFAALLGVPKSTYYRYESGERDVPIGIMRSAQHLWKKHQKNSKSSPGSPSGHRVAPNYEQEDERIMPGKGGVAPDSDRGSFGAPDLTGHHVTKLYIPDGTGPPAENSLLGRAVTLLANIIGSGNEIFTQALMSNLVAFSAAVNKEKEQNHRINNLEKECDELRKRVALLEDKLALISPQSSPKETAA